ncbi:hypothetical protein IW137_002321 [Coemansia sp. RSA 1287]|nr:hypothetical protein IW142_003236 [Coemansia sp. RSA 564]KAJ2249326.1 hypothetical protein GGH97_001360 [Coemansia sp. RSA 475]KAJ2643623.1 hypothetical protein IW137_002321 [Coemansia sp. RSA 1287]
MVRRRAGQKRAKRERSQAHVLSRLGCVKDGQDTDASYSTDVEPSGRSPRDAQQSARGVAEQVKFFKTPLKVSYYSWLYVQSQLRAAGAYAMEYPRTLLYSAVVGMLYTAMHFIRGPHTRVISSLDGTISWYSYWVVLGILSSIGLGAGLHTFVLFLGPHIARVTLTAHECQSVVFAVRGSGAFECIQAGGAGFSDILQKVILESLCWGAGTAIGELPPYFIARAAARGSNLEPTRGESLKDRTLLFVHTLLRRFGFLGILLFAAIPNPLFDLAGITCGHFQIPFWTFFGATLLGKSVIKSTVQTIVVITAFSKETVDGVLLVLQRVSPMVHKVAQRVLSKSMEFEHTDESVLGSVWNMCVTLMLVYFVVSTLEAFAQSYVSDVKRWKWHKQKR